MASKGVPHGTASLYLSAGVSFLREDEAVFEAMVEGWTAQQRGGRNLREKSTDRVVGVVRQFQRFLNEWPWQWDAAGFDEWMLHLVSVRRLAHSTVRGHQYAVRSFCDYLCSAHYGWVAMCEERFGNHPTQVCHEWNTTKHLLEYEGLPKRRPLIREELQRMFDHADAEVDRRLDSGRKGALPAYRDATMLKVAYAWGLRAAELAGLDITDFSRNAHAPEFGDYGNLLVRWGKAASGGAPKRRSVISLRLWAVAAVKDYVENIRPLMNPENSSALWLSERGGRLRSREASERFAEYRDVLGLGDGLTLHSLRHSYVTHLIEDGFDPVFVQQQVGHTYQSTTAIYTSVSGDFANTMMRQALQKAIPRQLEGREPDENHRL